MEEHTNGEQGLRVSRYQNGKIAEIDEYIYLEDYYDSPDDEFAKPILHLNGISLSFYKNGKLKKIAVYEEPKIKRPASPDRDCERIYWDDLIWNKTFSAQGKVIQSYGKQEKLKLPAEISTLLKNEGLLSEVQKALSNSSAPMTRPPLPERGRH